MAYATAEARRKGAKKRYERRKSQALILLGSKCVTCGSTENLEFDHIDPSNKAFTIGKTFNRSEATFLAEVKKCQLLCKKCHVEKSVEERGETRALGTHGTLSSYRYCKCTQCKLAKSNSNRSQRVRNSLARSS